MIDQVHNSKTKMKSIRKNQIEIIEIKITVTEMKNAFDGSSIDSNS